MTVTNSTGPVLWSVDSRGVARVSFNRPEVNNAYDGALIKGVLSALEALSGVEGLRAVLLTGNGRHFQAGADLKWLDGVAKSSPAANVDASRATAEAVRRLNLAPVPTVALVQGGCFGGGTGIIAACDIVIAADTAVFSISEVRWGLTAAIILPQLIDAMSLRQLRRYALTGERFDAKEARRIGLVHEVVAAGEIEAAGEQMISRLLENGPTAIAETKALSLECAGANLDADEFARLVEAVTRPNADRREAAEGLTSFRRKARGAVDARIVTVLGAASGLLARPGIPLDAHIAVVAHATILLLLSDPACARWTYPGRAEFCPHHTPADIVPFVQGIPPFAYFGESDRAERNHTRRGHIQDEREFRHRTPPCHNIALERQGCMVSRP